MVGSYPHPLADLRFLREHVVAFLRLRGLPQASRPDLLLPLSPGDCNLTTPCDLWPYPTIQKSCMKGFKGGG